MARHRTHSIEFNPRRKRRFVATTDSNHDGPVFLNVARGFEVHGPDQLWVADITYIAIAVGFVYLAVILDAWSRRVVGYALRNLPRCFAPRNAKRYTKQRGSLLWTTGTTRKTALRINQGRPTIPRLNGAFLLRPALYI